MFFAGLLSLRRYQRPKHNMAVDLAPFGCWTLRDKPAQRRSFLRYTI